MVAVGLTYNMTYKFVLAIGLSISPAVAQTQHSVALSWTDTANHTGTTYTVYRASGLCSGTPVFAKLATGITIKTYADASVTPGNYCYTATATLNGMESAQAAAAAAAVLPDPPTGLTVTAR